MATRQYIGARYVPKFDGAWDNTKDYAPLTVVSYEGNSYTSRTYVPSGTAITNETYWALSGNYNAQVESYRAEVAALADEVTAINVKVDDLKLSDLSSDNGKFICGNFSTDIYQNGLCTDGEYFYMVLSDSNGVNEPKLWKVDSGGNKIADLGLGSGHLGAAAYNPEDEAIYVIGSTSTLLKVDKSLSAYETVSLSFTGLLGISFDEGFCYAVTATKVYKLNDNFNVVTSEDIDFPNISESLQCAKVYGNLIFISCNYPNAIIVFDYVNSKVVKTIDLDGYIDGVNIGEVQELDVVNIDGITYVFLSATKTVLSGVPEFYNSIYILAGDFSHFPEKQGVVNTNKGIRIYVDGSSIARQSLGTSDFPFKSLLEACQHLNYEGSVNLIINHTNSVIDNLAAIFYIPAITGDVTINAIDSAHFEYFRFSNSQLDINYKATGTHEISFSQCVAGIKTSESSDAGTSLTISNRTSNLSINGDLYQSYNVSGITLVNGTLNRETGTSGKTKATSLTKYTVTNPIVELGNGLRYQETLVTSGAGTLRLEAINRPFAGILSFVCNGSAAANRTFFVRGYGSGGSVRMAIGLLPPDNTNGTFTPTLDDNANAIDIAIAASETIRCTYTALGYDPSNTDNGIEVSLAFTPST